MSDEEVATDAFLASVHHLGPERAIHALLTVNMELMARYVGQIREEGYRAGYAARRAEEAREEAVREREFFDHARLITRISELPDRH